jgi:phospholipid-translocating P-type ATPase (flippase)
VSVAHRLNVQTGEVSDIKWVDITVGDVIEVRNRELIPSDLVILESSESSGLCFVMTANLDGETNLKLRQVNTDMKSRKFKKGSELRCELPNNHLGTFEGTLTDVSDGESFALTNANFLLRGTQLRNTSYVRGLVTFVGRETKIQMNAAKTPHKMSSLTKLGNTETVIIFLVQCCFCLLCGVLASMYAQNKVVRDNQWIWGDDKPDSAGTSFMLKFFTYMLIFTNFIPIAHVVQLDLAKLFQSALMRRDLKCYHEVTDVYGSVTQFPLDARSAELNEELGMVEYVFSDKTGTLTCNVMEFRKCSIGGISYGLGTTEIGRAYRARNNMPIPPEPVKPADEPNTPYVNFVDPTMSAILKDKGHPRAQAVHEFFLSLALNHEVMPEENNGEIILSASNPDEAALVYAAKHCGRSFFKRVRTEHEELTLAIEAENVTFTLLHNLEFSSERKRSSVIVKMVDGTILLFCKGADNIILELLSKDPKINDPEIVATTKNHLLEYVNDGLRTLLLAQVEIPKAKYEAWAKRMHEADIALVHRQESRIAVMAEIEKDLKLMGATAIEDKLQEGVGDAISSLRLGGVKVWMLTGDKVGTAVNIGFSCELITKEMLSLQFVGGEAGQQSEIPGKGKLVGLEKLSKISGQESADAIQAQLRDLLQEVTAVTKLNPNREVCLIVDTDALTALEIAMQRDVELGKLFIALSDKVKSVICARVSPKQKARIVKMVREASPKTVTLSIGDGANDVPMIQTAHVGIGIYGLEGRQAVNASDYAIGQFRFLKTLLLVHGRWNHRRCGILTNYLFYKNSVLVLPNFFLGFYCLMSGSFFYYDTFYQFFNTFFTSLPILYLASLDQDVSADVAISRPSIYRDGIERVFITHKIFWRWMMEGMYSGAVVFFIPVALFAHFNLIAKGQTIGFWELGMLIFFLDVVVVQLRLCLEICYWTGIECIAFFLSLVPGLWGLWYYFSSQVDFEPPGLLSSYRIYGTYEFLFGIRMFWFAIAISSVICLVPIFVFMVS